MGMKKMSMRNVKLKVSLSYFQPYVSHRHLFHAHLKYKTLNIISNFY